MCLICYLTCQLTVKFNNHVLHFGTPDLVERVQSMINGTLAELDALPPFPDESEFQSLLSDQVYPFLAAAQSLAAEDVEIEVVLDLVNEVL